MHTCGGSLPGRKPLVRPGKQRGWPPLLRTAPQDKVERREKLRLVRRFFIAFSAYCVSPEEGGKAAAAAACVCVPASTDTTRTPCGLPPAAPPPPPGHRSPPSPRC